MTTQMPSKPVPAGASPGAEATAAAALAICKSLLRALNGADILPEHQIVGVLRDAATAHLNDPGEEVVMM